MADRHVRIRAEGDIVVMVIDGEGYPIPWQKADEIAAALKASARKAEEREKANQVIMDNATMQRAGFPVGLSNDPVIRRETVKEALHNRDLRRYLKGRQAAGLGGIQSRGAVGAPSLIKRSS